MDEQKKRDIAQVIQEADKETKRQFIMVATFVLGLAVSNYVLKWLEQYYPSAINYLGVLVGTAFLCGLLYESAKMTVNIQLEHISETKVTFKFNKWDAILGFIIGNIAILIMGVHGLLWLNPLSVPSHWIYEYAPYGYVGYIVVIGTYMFTHWQLRSLLSRLRLKKAKELYNKFNEEYNC